MKKTSKKNKIIILTAIALIIVIIGILIGTNAIKVNILTGKYNSANNGSSNGNLLPEYIKSGITLAGVTGTLEVLDTSDATATAEDIAKGKTAYVDGKKITGTKIVPISEINLSDVYYADLPGEDGKPDGIPDGVIYADLAVGGSGEWETNGMGKYEIPTETNLKQYYIEEENYYGVFGTGKVIAQMEGTTGINNRFYVMALEDVNQGTLYCWYDAAVAGKLDKPVPNSENDFGKGKENTIYALDKWNDESLPWGKHNSNRRYLDMWGVIEDEIDAGWFVPSKSEWAAFGDKLKITSGNYENKSLRNAYWSSSQRSTSNAYYANFNAGYITSGVVNRSHFVRLSTTF